MNVLCIVLLGNSLLGTLLKLSGDCKLEEHL